MSFRRETQKSAQAVAYVEAPSAERVLDYLDPDSGYEVTFKDRREDVYEYGMYGEEDVYKVTITVELA